MFGMFFLALIMYWGFLALIFLLDPSRTHTPRNVTCYADPNENKRCHSRDTAGSTSDNPIEISDDDTASADKEDCDKEDCDKEDCDKDEATPLPDHDNDLPTQDVTQTNRASMRPRKAVRYDDCNDITAASPEKPTRRRP
jgi:hypothetical protein